MGKGGLPGWKETAGWPSTSCWVETPFSVDGGGSSDQKKAQGEARRGRGGGDARPQGTDAAPQEPRSVTRNRAPAPPSLPLGPNPGETWN